MFKLHLVNPFNWFRGMIKFPIGYYTFNGCDCRTCVGCNGGRPGWGFNFLLIGFSISK